MKVPGTKSREINILTRLAKADEGGTARATKATQQSAIWQAGPFACHQIFQLFLQLNPDSKWPFTLIEVNRDRLGNLRL